MGDEDILTELDISDEHNNEQVRLFMRQPTDPELYVYDGTDAGVTVDFTDSLIRLKKVNILLHLFIIRAISILVYCTECVSE